MKTPAITLHGITSSGHTHRVELLLSMLQLPYQMIPTPPEVRRKPAFLRLNPSGQIPVLEHDGLTIADSNAILVYLARRFAPGSHWLPDDPLMVSQIQRWLSVAAGELMYGPAKARMIAMGKLRGSFSSAIAISKALLTRLEEHLSNTDYLATDNPTIADLACYTYIAHAPEVGIALDGFLAIQHWLNRIESLPGFNAMPLSPALSGKAQEFWAYRYMMPIY